MCEDVVGNAVVGIRCKNPAVVHADTATFLSAVLESEETVICGRCEILFLSGIDAEDATFFMKITHNRFLFSFNAYVIRDPLPETVLY